MPIDDGELADFIERITDGVGQPWPIRDTMKCIRHENKIRRLPNQVGQFVGIARHIVAIHNTILIQPMTRNFEQARVNVDCDDLTCDFGDLQCEPTIPGAKIYYRHPRFDPDCGKDTGRIRP